MQANPQTAVVILAAGLGTRMKSDRAKVLHEIQGRPMILHVMETARQLACGAVVVVVGHQADEVRRSVTDARHEARFALQDRQLGTGHAVQCALAELPDPIRDVIILCGDVPLVEPDLLRGLYRDHLAERRDLTVLAVTTDTPDGYGRILLDGGGAVTGIVEQADATEEQKRIDLINSGIYCVERSFLEKALGMLQCNNAQGEYYLTDIIAIGYAQGLRLGAVTSDRFEEIIGVNSRADLARVEAILARKQGKMA